MKQKQIFIILGAIGIIFISMLVCLAILTLAVKNLRGSANKDSDPVVVDVTLCDEDASELCIVTFGANNLNRMVITFQLPNADYVPFYIKADNRGSVSIYTCQADKSAPTNVYCTGVRTPLGETINIEAYTTDENTLIARGSFLVSAIALSTPIILPTDTPIEEETPTSSPSPEEFFLPGLGEPTSTPDFGYPNP